MDALAAAVEAIRAGVPDVEAIYLFGSRATGEAGPASDADLAVLAAAPLDEVARWNLASRLAGILRLEVDLVDLRRCSAVMRVQVLGRGRLLLDLAPAVRAGFEAFALSDYARLNEERRGILADVKARGSIRG